MRPLAFMIGLKLYCLITLTGLVTSTEYDESFIAYVHKFFKPSSISLIHFTDQDNFVQMKSLFNMQEFFSKSKQIMTTTLNIEKELLINGNSTDWKSLRSEKDSLNVFFITSEDDVKKMTIVVNTLYPNGKVNLVIFLKTEENSLPDFCENPVGNPFNLNEGRLLIVKCYEDTTIQEWYSLNKDKMTTYKRGTWQPQGEINLSLKNSLDIEREALNGKVLRLGKVKTTERFPYHVHGLLDDIKMAGNFTTKTVKIVDDAGKWNEKTQRGSGGIGLIVNDEVDFVQTWYQISSVKFLPVDFTTIATTTQMCLYLKKPTSRSIGAWSLYTKPFTYDAWLAYLWSLFLALILVTIMRVTLENPVWYGDMILENFSNIWGIFCQQGLADFPAAASLRTFYCTMYLFTFAMLSSYGAAFVSYLTLSDVSLPFESLEELGEVGSYKLAMFDTFGTYDNIANAENAPWKEVKHTLLNKNELPKSVEEALRMVCNEKIVLLDNDLFVQLIPMGTYLPCRLVRIHTGQYERFTFILRKKSPYTKAINFYISKMKNVGLHQKYERSTNHLLEKFYFSDEGDYLYYKVTVQDVEPLIVVLLGALVLSIIIGFLENIIFWICEQCQ